MLNKKSFFTAFFLTSITCMMLTVAEPRPNAPLNTNSPFESEKPVKGEKKLAPTFGEKEVLLKPVQFQLKQSLIFLARKSKEKFSR